MSKMGNFITQAKISGEAVKRGFSTCEKVEATGRYARFEAGYWEGALSPVTVYRFEYNVFRGGKVAATVWQDPVSAGAGRPALYEDEVFN